MAYTLADLRLMHNKSYQDVCEYLSLNVRSYRVYEGRNYIPKKYLIKLSTYYNVSLSDIDTTPKKRFSSRGKERKYLPFRLKELRESLHLTQRELAKELGLSYYLISEIERLGTCKPEHYLILTKFAAEHQHTYKDHSIDELLMIIYDLEKRVKHLETMIASQ